MAGSVWCSCHRGSFHVQVPRPWPETTVGAGGLRHCLVQPHPAQAWKIHSEGKGTTSGASEMLLEFCCACLCHSFVPFLLFKGAKWKTPFFGCLFSLLMRRHLEILLRFQPIPLASFNFRRGLVVYLGGFVCFFMYLYNDTLLPCRHYPCPWAGGSCWGYPKLGCCVCLHKSQLTDTVGALGSLFSPG